MLQSIWDDIRRTFSFGNMINRLIIINAAVYVVMTLIWVFTSWSDQGLYNTLFSYLAASDYWWHMLTRPWTLLTHMFLHFDFWHVAMNMLFLYWFGRIFGDMVGDQYVLPLYLSAGLAGFLAYFVVFNLMPGATGIVAGASGAVAGVIVATGVITPEYEMRLLFLGNVKLKWIVLAAIFMQFVNLGREAGSELPSNFGGTIGHLGGIAFGILYATQRHRGRDLLEPAIGAIDWVEKTYNNLVSPSQDHQQTGPRRGYRKGQSVGQTTTVKSRPSFMRKAGGKSAPTQRTDQEPTPGISHQEKIDAILDKIKDRGYNSLTKEEKDYLLKASNKK